MKKKFQIFKTSFPRTVEICYNRLIFHLNHLKYDAVCFQICVYVCGESLMIFRLIFQISQSFLGDTLMKYYLFYGKSWMLIMWTYKGWHNYLFCPYFNSLTSFLSFFYSFTHSRNTDSLSVPMYLSWSHCRASELDFPSP